MKNAIRGRRDARFLPSRHHFALFRLAAWLRLRLAPPETGEVVMVVESYQSAVESPLLALWYTTTVAAYLAAELGRVMPLLLATAAAIPLSLIAVELPFYFSGLLIGPLVRLVARRPGNDHKRANGVVMLALLLAISVHYVRAATWVRFVGGQVLFCFALNLVCAAILLPLRGIIRRDEASLRGAASAA